MTSIINTYSDNQQWLTARGFDPSRPDKLYRAVKDFFRKAPLHSLEYWQSHQVIFQGGSVRAVEWDGDLPEKVAAVVALILDMPGLAFEERAEFMEGATAIFRGQEWNFVHEPGIKVAVGDTILELPLALCKRLEPLRIGMNTFAEAALVKANQPVPLGLPEGVSAQDVVFFLEAVRNPTLLQGLSLGELLPILQIADYYVADDFINDFLDAYFAAYKDNSLKAVKEVLAVISYLGSKAAGDRLLSTAIRKYLEHANNHKMTYELAFDALSVVDGLEEALQERGLSLEDLQNYYAIFQRRKAASISQQVIADITMVKFFWLNTPVSISNPANMLKVMSLTKTLCSKVERNLFSSMFIHYFKHSLAEHKSIGEIFASLGDLCEKVFAILTDEIVSELVGDSIQQALIENQDLTLLCQELKQYLHCQNHPLSLDFSNSHVTQENLEEIAMHFPDVRSLNITKTEVDTIPSVWTSSLHHLDAEIGEELKKDAALRKIGLDPSNPRMVYDALKKFAAKAAKTPNQYWASRKVHFVNGLVEEIPGFEGNSDLVLLRHAMHIALKTPGLSFTEKAKLFVGVKAIFDDREVSLSDVTVQVRFARGNVQVPLSFYNKFPLLQTQEPFPLPDNCTIDDVAHFLEIQRVGGLSTEEMIQMTMLAAHFGNQKLEQDFLEDIVMTPISSKTLKNFSSLQNMPPLRALMRGYLIHSLEQGKSPREVVRGVPSVILKKLELSREELRERLEENITPEDIFAWPPLLYDLDYDGGMLRFSNSITQLSKAITEHIRDELSSMSMKEICKGLVPYHLPLRLNLADCYITNEDLQELARIYPRVHTLCVSNTKITEIPEVWRAHLCALDVCHTPISELPSDLTALHWLNAERTWNLSDISSLENSPLHKAFLRWSSVPQIPQRLPVTKEWEAGVAALSMRDFILFFGQASASPHLLARYLHAYRNRDISLKDAETALSFLDLLSEEITAVTLFAFVASECEGIEELPQFQNALDRFFAFAEEGFDGYPKLFAKLADRVYDRFA